MSGPKLHMMACLDMVLLYTAIVSTRSSPYWLREASAIGARGARGLREILPLQSTGGFADWLAPDCWAVGCFGWLVGWLVGRWGIVG